MFINLERKHCFIGYYGDDIIGYTVYNIRDIDLLMSSMYSLLSPGIFYTSTEYNACSISITQICNSITTCVCYGSRHWVQSRFLVRFVLLNL